MPDDADRLYERVLVLRCQTGDAGAFAEIVERYNARLRYFLRKMLRDAHRAEDSLQDVWLAAFRGLPRLEDAAAFPAWLYRIARDRVSRELRFGLRRPVHVDVEAGSMPAGEPEFTPEDAAEVHAGLDTLAPEAREALLLRFVEGMTYEQIAEVTRCPAGTVRSRVHYAKKALRSAMERRNSNG